LAWDQSNSAKALASIFDGSGFSSAIPHTFRRTVATLLDQAGVPIARIADQLGHADPAMTASVYLGRDRTATSDRSPSTCYVRAENG
jgi:integrase